jgi:hypothetical protein
MCVHVCVCVCICVYSYVCQPATTYQAQIPKRCEFSLHSSSSSCCRQFFRLFSHPFRHRCLLGKSRRDPLAARRHLQPQQLAHQHPRLYLLQLRLGVRELPAPVNVYVYVCMYVCMSVFICSRHPRLDLPQLRLCVQELPAPVNVYVYVCMCVYECVYM